jgi:hypothetical protein
MDKLIGIWSYRLGIVSASIALVWRLANALSFVPNSFMRIGVDVSYWSFFHVATLLFVVTIATTCHVWLSTQK